MSSLRSTCAVIGIVLGTLVATMGVAKTDPSVDGFTSTLQWNAGFVSVGLLALAVGILLLRQDRAAQRATAVGASGSLAALTVAAEAAAAGVEALTLQAVDMDLASLHAAVDGLVSGPVADFVEQRGALADAHGQRRFAEVMGAFSPAERQLNRAWSASADGYQDEAVASLRRAAPGFAEARERLSAPAAV